MPALLLVADDGDNSDGLTWATAYQNITTALTNVDAGGVIKVASEHIQTVAAALSLGSTNGTLALPVTIISVNKDDSDAYLAMRDDAAPGKIECTGAANDLSFTNSDIYVGLTFNVSDDLKINTATKQYNMIDCKFSVVGNYVCGGSGYNNSIYWENCIYEQAGAGYFSLNYGVKFIWNGGTFSFDGGSVITRLFFWAARTVFVEVSDVDFQDLDAGDSLVHGATISACDSLFKRCKVPAALGGLLEGAVATTGADFKFHSVSNSDIIYQLQENYYEGQVNEDTATYYDATYDGTNGYSIKMVSTANSIEWTRPLRFKLAEVWASANPTLTVELNTDNVVLQNDEFWIEIEYPDDTTGALGGLDQTSRATTVVTTPANLTTSVVAWTEAFGTEKPQSVEVTIANGQEGMHTIWACLGKASTTAYVCPKVVVT